MNQKDQDKNVNHPGRGLLGDIDPVPTRKEEFPNRGNRPGSANDAERRPSTRVNDDDVGGESKEP